MRVDSILGNSEPVLEDVSGTVRGADDEAAAVGQQCEAGHTVKIVARQRLGNGKREGAKHTAVDDVEELDEAVNSEL